MLRLGAPHPILHAAGPSAGRRGARFGRRGGGAIVQLPNFPVFIIAGQSNAMGRTDAMSSPPTLPDARVRCSVYVDGAIDGASPRSLDQFTYKGPEAGFGVAYANARGNCGISKWVWNSTGMEANWTPWQGDASAVVTSAKLSDAIVQTRTFIEQLVTEDASRRPYVAGFYWNQWETDAAGTRSAIYVDMLRVLVSRVRAEFGAGLPVYIGKVSDNFAGDIGTYPTANVDNIKAAHTTIDGESALNILVSTDGLTMEIDGVHYTSDSQETLGERLATAVLAVDLPTFSSGFMRANLYTSRAAAEAVGTAYASPCDNRAWAVASATGQHWIPTSTWPAAGVTKGLRFYPYPNSPSNGVGGSIPAADRSAAVGSGRWYLRIRPGFLSTSETTLRRVLYQSTAYSIHWIGSTKQWDVRMNSTDCLCDATTFNGTTDEFVIDIDFTNDLVRFYKNGTIIGSPVAQAQDWSASAAAIQIGAVSFATANQWVGDIYEPVEGAYTP